MFKRKRSKAGYWFTIQSPNGQTLATSETYTTAAMRDKGIEAVKAVVSRIVGKETLTQLQKDLGGPLRKRRPSYLEAALQKELKSI